MQRRLSFISACLGREGRRRRWESNLDLAHSIKQYHVAWFIRPIWDPQRTPCAACIPGLGTVKKKMCSQRRSLPSRSVCGLWLMYSLARAVCVRTDNIVLQASVRQAYDACFGHGADTAVDSHKCRCPRGLVARRSPWFRTFHSAQLDAARSVASAVALMAQEEKWTRSAALSHLRHFLMLTLCCFRNITRLTLTAPAHCRTQSSAVFFFFFFFLLKAKYRWRYSVTHIRAASSVWIHRLLM